MVRALTCAALLAGLAEAGPVAAERWVKSETERETVYIDKMTDGSFRESKVAKAPSVVRTRLIATNDVGFAWRYDYEAKLSDGRTVTNAAFEVKTPKELAAAKIDKIGRTLAVPQPVTNAAERIELALGRIRAPAARSLASATVTETRRMANSKRAVASRRLGGDRVELTLADGRAVTTAVQRVTSAKPSPNAKPGGGKADGKGSGKAAAEAGKLAAAALAGAAAGAAASGAKKRGA